MKTGRRVFLASFAVTLAGADAMWAMGQRQVPSAQNPQQVPQFPGTGVRTACGRHSSSSNGGCRREQLKESQKTLRLDADHLLQLAQELKDEADKTEQTDVLSLSLVHKAEEVEKLAKQIKDLVRAAWVKFTYATFW